MRDGFFDFQQLEIIAFCADECERQRSGSKSVYYMVNAWNFAAQMSGLSDHLSLDLIREIGAYVEPKKSQHFREIPVFVGDKEMLNYTLIERALVQIIVAVNDKDISPEEFYRQFEEIHPFVDGNGRTGVILFNYLKNTLGWPKMPPSFWG